MCVGNVKDSFDIHTDAACVEICKIYASNMGIQGERVCPYVLC